MVYLVCPECKVGLRISPGEPGEFESLFEVSPVHLEMTAYSCFKCELEMASLSLEPPDGVEMFDVNPQEAFAAINGLGLPGEQECSAASVVSLLIEKKIARASTRMIRNSHRCIIDWVEFEDGTKMYFGASTVGAIVYRIAPKHSYVKEVMRG